MWDKERLRKQQIEPWKALQQKGVGVHVGEWGAFSHTPHAAVLVYGRASAVAAPLVAVTGRAAALLAAGRAAGVVPARVLNLTQRVVRTMFLNKLKLVLGVVVALTPGLPVIQVLVAVQAVDCVLLPVVLFAILRLINKPRLMGDLVNGPIYNVIARVTAVVVTILSLVLLGTTVLQVFGVNIG